MNKYLTNILIFIALIFYQTASFSAPASKDVNVVNTPDVNVVSMPPVEVTVPSALDANIVNEPTVNVGNIVDISGGVTVTNDETAPVPVTVIDGTSLRPAEYRFIGVSTSTFNGSGGMQGFKGMHAACQSTFSRPEARMCTTEEIFKTPGLASFPLDIEGWVQPIIVGAGYDPSSNSVVMVEKFLGAENTRTMNCWSWVSFYEPHYGTIYHNGESPNVAARFDLRPCDEIRPVACCALEQ